MKAAVVYYSMSGNTQFAAEKIAEKLGADLIRLVPKTSYPAAGFKKFLIGGRDALKAAEPELEAYAFDAEKYDLIVYDEKLPRVELSSLLSAVHETGIPSILLKRRRDFCPRQFRLHRA